MSGHSPEAEFLDEIQTKVLIFFLLAIHSHLYSFALRFLFFQTHATSYSFYSSVTVHCKWERRKTDRKPNPLTNDLRNPHRNLKYENSQDYAQKPQKIVCSWIRLQAFFVLLPRLFSSWKGTSDTRTLRYSPRSIKTFPETRCWTNFAEIWPVGAQHSVMAGGRWGKDDRKQNTLTPLLWT